MDDIIKLLDLEDDNFIVKNIRVDWNVKYVDVETAAVEHFCPCCGSKMHSRGTKLRAVRHPILQDGFRLVINLKQRRWQCTNPNCKYNFAEQFKFVSKGKQLSNATDIMIVDALKDLQKTAAEVGRQFGVSDHHVIDVFSKYIHMKRSRLPEILSVDEVYLDIDNYCKYALVLQDFSTGEPVDLVKSRRKNVTEPYFMNIPREERYSVKYVISDMYNPYIDYVNNYFPNAVSVVDSFHVMQWIVQHLDAYLKKRLKEFKERDTIREMERLHINIRPENIPISREVYFLQKHRWVMLKNKRNIDYNADKRMNRFLNMALNAYDYEKLFFSIDPDFEELRDLKEMYADFNLRNVGNPSAAAEELDDLIEYYRHSKHDIFREFSRTLSHYRQPIINSFIYFDKIGDDGTCKARLSNGPIESLNRKAKDLKRNSRGYLNYDHLRNRFLYSTRKIAHISFK